MMKKLGIILLVLFTFTSYAVAQPTGKLKAWNVWGNGSSNEGYAKSIPLQSILTGVPNLTLTTPNLAGGALSGTFSGNFTFSGIPIYSGLSVVSCTSGLGLDGSNNLIKIGCPTSASAIQDGTTTVTSGTSSTYLYNNAGVLGHVAAAAKSDQQTGTSTSEVVTPSQQQSHDSAAKAWCYFNGTTAGTNACSGGAYNVTSVTRTSVGQYTLNFTTPFFNASYLCTGMVKTSAANAVLQGLDGQAASAYNFLVESINPIAAIDITAVGIVCYGRQ